MSRYMRWVTFASEVLVESVASTGDTMLPNAKDAVKTLLTALLLESIRSGWELKYLAVPTAAVASDSCLSASCDCS